MKTPTMNDTVARLQREAEDAAGLEPLPEFPEASEPREGRVLEGVEIDEQARIEWCRSCNAPIWWGKTRAGKSNPFDVVGGVRSAVTHFSTCPQAPQWSKR